MEKLSLGRWHSTATPKDPAASSVPCPSCDHANPAGSHFCNQCGMPVHFETCGRCEAINLRGATVCHKCGAGLAGVAISASTAAAPVDAEVPLAQATDRFGSPANVASAAIAKPAARSPRAGVRAALMALGLALVAVPAYIATEHPEWWQPAVNEIAQQGKPTVEAAPVPAPAEAAPASPATTEASVAAPPPVADARGSEVARDFNVPKATSAAAAAPAGAKNARPSTTKSTASRSKPVAPRKPARKPAGKSP